MEKRSETTREARREHEDGARPNARDTSSVAPKVVRKQDPRRPDPSSGGDIRSDNRLKGGSTGGGAR